MKIAEEIETIFKETLPELEKEEFNPKKQQEEFQNWDSFTHLELVEKVERKFNLKLNIEEVVELNSPQKFMDLVFSKRGEEDEI